MTESSASLRVVTPWHVWLVGVLALLWNCVGAFDYFMTESHNASYLSAFTPQQLAYFDSFPAWVVATWALGVWGGVLRSVLLLLRRKSAVPVFVISLVGMLITFFHNYMLADWFATMGGMSGLAFTVAIVI